MDVDPVVASVAGHRRSPDPVTVSHLKGPLGALLARRLVGKVEDARAESLRIHELQGLPNAPVLEVALPATHDHGMDHEPKLVEWVLAQQRPDEGATAYALDLIGERWALLVVRELLLGPKRFTDLRAGLPHANPNVLAQRLRELERAGAVQRGKLPPPPASRAYELTEWGLQLEPVIISLGRWGARSPSKSRAAALGVDSLVLSFRTMFDLRAAEGLIASYELRLGEDRFRAEVVNGRFEIARGGAEQPDAIIKTDAATLDALVYDGRPLAEALRSGDVKIEGDESAAERFLTLFPLPEPAAPVAGAYC